MFNRSRAMLAAAFAAAFSPISAAAAQLGDLPNNYNPDARRDRWRGPHGTGNRGYKHPITGERVFKRPAVPFVRNPDNGLHWEHGQLVGPARGNASLYGPRGALEPKRGKAKASARKPEPKKYSTPKAEARSLRRTGTISPRQQRKLRKRDHRLIAPRFYGLDLGIHFDKGQADTTAVQSLGAAP